MYKNKPIQLLELLKDEAVNWLNTFDTVFTDCDGVLWNEDTAIPGVPEAIALLKAHGKQVYFATNNALQTRREIWKKANAIGYEIAETHIIAPIQSIIEYLKGRDFHKQVYVIGSEAISRGLSEAGIQSFGSGPDVLDTTLTEFIAQSVATRNDHDVGAIVVGYDEQFTYAKMMKACNYVCLNADCLFLATNLDPVHRYPQYRIPGTGAILSALEAFIGRSALVFGKPSPEVCEDLVKSRRVVPERTLMIGDTCKIDVLFGHNCGFQTLLVGTGPNSEYELNELLQNVGENHNCIPDIFLPSLSDIKRFI